MEKEMATHSGILARKILWTEEPVHGVTELDMVECMCTRTHTIFTI